MPAKQTLVALYCMTRFSRLLCQSSGVMVTRAMVVDCKQGSERIQLNEGATLGSLLAVFSLACNAYATNK